MDWQETIDALRVSKIDEDTFDWIFEPLNKQSLRIIKGK